MNSVSVGEMAQNDQEPIENDQTEDQNDQEPIENDQTEAQNDQEPIENDQAETSGKNFTELESIIGRKI
ncbi:hypothetical protein U1Q18_050895, partial [Sarracenia purpurea var. burkii]